MPGELGGFKTPSKSSAVGEFPATASGWIKKFELREVIEMGRARRIV